MKKVKTDNIPILLVIVVGLMLLSIEALVLSLISLSPAVAIFGLILAVFSTLPLILSVIKFKPLWKSRMPKISWKVKLLLKLLRIKVVPIEKVYPEPIILHWGDGGKAEKHLPKAACEGKHRIGIDKFKATNYSYLHEIGHALTWGKTNCCDGHDEFAAHFIAMGLMELLNIDPGESSYDEAMDQYAGYDPKCTRLNRRAYYMLGKDTSYYEYPDIYLSEEELKKKEKIGKVADEALKKLDEIL